MTHERKTLLFSALILGACVALAVAFRSKALPVATPAHAADSVGARKAVNVTYITPETGNIRRAVRMAADIKPDREAMIYGKVSGYVKPHPVEVGTRVDATTVLAEVAVPDLDAAVVTAASSVALATAAIGEADAATIEARQHVTEAQAHVRQVEGTRKTAEAAVAETAAEMKLAGTIYARLENVKAKSPNLVAQDQVDKAAGERDIARARHAAAEVGVAKIDDDVLVANARVAAAKARVTAAEAGKDAAVAQESLAKALKVEAETRQGFGRILAPFAGVVAERMIDTGDLVKDATRNSGAKPLFRIVADDKIRVRFYISEPDAPMCKPGNRIELIVDVLDGGKPFEGTVTRIADALDAKTRTMEVEAEMPNPPVAGHPKLRADMFARVKVFLEEYKDVLIVPARCVRTKKRKSSVMVIQSDGTVKSVDIVIGVDDGKHIQIKSGKVDASTQIVYTGRNLVAKGEKVNGTKFTPKDRE